MIADLSHYQKTIDWEMASKDLDLVILRATVGYNTDTKYDEYCKNCKKHNIPYGTYHYVKALSESNAELEAEFFFKTASVHEPLFYVADIEYDPLMEINYDKIAYTFLSKLKQLGAKKLGLYIGQNYYPKCKLSQSIIDFNWIPRYGLDNGKFDSKYTPTCYYDLHQYTSKGYLAGTDGTVDLNRLSGTKPLEWFTEEKKMAYVMTAKELINKALNIVNNHKTIYMYAAYGFQVTDATIASKAKQNLNGWYTQRNINKLKAVANQTPPIWGFDCVNLYKALLWGWTGDPAKEKGGAVYKANGVPDSSANGIFNKCLNKSTDFSTIQPGEAVWIPGHFGLYIGNGKVIECTPSWDDGVQITGLKNIKPLNGYNNRAWDKHGFLPWIDYEGAEIPVVKEFNLGERDLYKGLTGQDVKELQEGLIQLGYNVGRYGADGDFGPSTKKAVIEFQINWGLDDDGIFGEKSFAMYNNLIDNGGEQIPTEPDDPVSVPETNRVYEVTGKSVYLWDGHPNHSGEKSIIVKKGDGLEIPDLGTYLPVIYNGNLKWINSKYVK